MCGFLSTPSARRATTAAGLPAAALSISIHALREEGDGVRKWSYVNGILFLSTPSARRATSLELFVDGGVVFLSTPSARRATIKYAPAFQGFVISIHALREEGDPSEIAKSNISVLFLSTPSARRATSSDC